VLPPAKDARQLALLHVPDTVFAAKPGSSDSLLPSCACLHNDNHAKQHLKQQCNNNDCNNTKHAEFVYFIIHLPRSLRQVKKKAVMFDDICKTQPLSRCAAGNFIAFISRMASIEVSEVEESKSDSNLNDGAVCSSWHKRCLHNIRQTQISQRKLNNDYNTVVL
jgi:hypothetical protein